MLILGKIHGKTTTFEFEFIVDKLVEGKAKKHEFLQVYHNDYGYVLCQITKLIKDIEKTIAKCNIIGYKDESTNIIKAIRTPFVPGTEVLLAEDDFINNILRFDDAKGAFIGKLEYRDIPIYLNINKLVTKHIAILAKTGAGKSYSVGVLIEEMLDKGIPLLIIDPHGEYSTLKDRNTNLFELEKIKSFHLDAKSYLTQVQEFGDINVDDKFKPLKLNDNFTSQELINLFPRLTSTQQAVLYSAIQDLDIVNFENLTEKLRFVDNNAKFTILSVLDYLKKTDLFSMFPTDYNEIITVGKASIINLKGMEPEIQQIIVYKLLKDLFQLRKQNKISPFFCVIEEAHNFIPEKHIGEAKSSSIIRTIASEGRKFGLGLCVVSQRPALVEKNVLSQCNTQIILKVTNPNDLKAITASSEGLSYNADDDIKNLAVGTAMVTGFTEMPLFVDIRPRKSKHGGTSIEIVKDQPEPKVLIEEVVEGKTDEDEDEEAFKPKEVYLTLDEFQEDKVEEEVREEVKEEVKEEEKEKQPELRLYKEEEKETEETKEHVDVVEQAKEYEELLPLIKPKLSKKDIRLISSEPIDRIDTVLVPGALIKCRRKDFEFNLLVDLIGGKIIEDVDKMKGLNIIDLTKFSLAEIQVLETGLHMYTFTESMVTSKTGLGITKVQNILNLLYNENVLAKKNEYYTVSHDSTLISHPQDYAYNEEIKYESIEFNEKEEAVASIDNVKQKLNQFVDIVDVKDCFIVKYEIIN